MFPSGVRGADADSSDIGNTTSSGRSVSSESLSVMGSAPSVRREVESTVNRRGTIVFETSELRDMYAWSRPRDETRFAPALDHLCNHCWFIEGFLGARRASVRSGHPAQRARHLSSLVEQVL